MRATEPLDSPYDVASDPEGNLYIADSANHVIRKLTAAGELTVIAGSIGVRGSADGRASAARFNRPQGIDVDNAGNIYVADTSNSTIRRISASGEVTTIAGQAGATGSADGPGSTARFDNPDHVAVDRNGNIYVSDSHNHTVRKITSAGVVSTLAGRAGVSGFADGTGSAARFDFVGGIAIDPSGTLFITDQRNHVIRRISSSGTVTTIAGDWGVPGSADGRGTVARFHFPRDIAIAASGVLYVADQFNETIRRVTQTGDVTTFAGAPKISGSADGVGSSARFNEPWGVAADLLGNVYVADRGNDAIRKITPQRLVSTLGTLVSREGSADGVGPNARFDTPSGIAVDRLGNAYVADTNNHTIRKVTPAGEVTTFAGMADARGDSDGVGPAARFNYPIDVAVDAAGNVYVADELSHTIRKITPAGEVSTFAGSPSFSGSANGARTAARFRFPGGVSVDSLGNVYVADTGNLTIRVIRSTGEVTTLAGLAGQDGSDDGVGSAARFEQPTDLAVDSQGNVFVADAWNHSIRKITPAGVVTTFVGLSGHAGSVDARGAEARFQSPYGIAVDDDDVIYVTEVGSHVIRRITPEGTVTTIAGRPFTRGHDDGPAASARFSSPRSIAVGPDGTLFVADEGNDAIRLGVPHVPQPRRRAAGR